MCKFLIVYYDSQLQSFVGSFVWVLLRVTQSLVLSGIHLETDPASPQSWPGLVHLRAALFVLFPVRLTTTQNPLSSLNTLWFSLLVLPPAGFSSSKATSPCCAPGKFWHLSEPISKLLLQHLLPRAEFWWLPEMQMAPGEPAGHRHKVWLSREADGMPPQWWGFARILTFCCPQTKWHQLFSSPSAKILSGFWKKYFEIYRRKRHLRDQ